MWPQEVKFEKKQSHSKFLKHLNVLMWKSYLQRVRRWRTLVAECIFALMMCILAIYIARPAFLTSLEAEPTPPVSLKSILGALQKDTILGYAPKLEPYNEIMDRTAEILGSEIIAGNDEQQLNNLLYKRANKNVIIKRVIWIIWRHHAGNNFKFSIRSTEVGALYVMEHIQAAGAGQDKVRRNPHLQAGFLSVECAINQALLEFTKKPEVNIQFTLKLVAMPVSPLMEEDKVRRAISLILMCYTLLLLPPVLETEALALTETNNKLKRALRIRDVDYSVIYLGWLTYAWLTAMPICLISGISLIVIFRWIHILYALITLLSYFTIMMTLAFMFSMFHEKVIIAAVWSILQTLTQTFLAELIVHHRKSFDHSGVTTFIFKTILPPLGLLVALNQFALLRTGRTDQSSQSNSVFFTILSWSMLFLLYFMLLMLLQRTIGSARAIGGQVSWKSIIFKQAVDKTKLRPIQSPNTERRSKLQEVDEMVAKAVSFNNVSKSIMEVQLLNQVSFDIYRGEFTSIFSERVQDQTITCVEDMLTGLTFPDSGTITVLGVILDPTRHMLNEHMMVGYCHQSSILIDDLTVEEHLHFYTMLCLWYEDNDDVFEFSVIRHQILKEECDLTEVYLERVDSLSDYYRAQLCWAIAILMEPRLVIMPEYDEHPIFRNVIKDKIMTNKSFMTLVSLTVSSMELQYADRLFLLDHRLLAFGGTPAYMFYKYGRDYRIRVNFKSGTSNRVVNMFANILHGYGAKTRAQLGNLLILRMPTTPTENVAKLTAFVESEKQLFNVVSMYVCLPDPEEVFRRAIHESREKTSEDDDNEEKTVRIEGALTKIAQDKDWKPQMSFCAKFEHLRIFAWKYVACYIHYRLFMIVTIISAIGAGICIGKSMSNMLQNFEGDKYRTKGVETLTVESYVTSKGYPTTLMVRVDKSDVAQTVASGQDLILRLSSLLVTTPLPSGLPQLVPCPPILQVFLMPVTSGTASSTGYVLSNANDSLLSLISYSAMVYPQSLTEYLATRAIDSPQHYVHGYAYGMDIRLKNDTLRVRALYSPLHDDRSAAARSIARVYMALMRYYSGKLDSFIEIEDSPLILDYTYLMKDASEPPLLIQTFLVFSVSHIVMLPSQEYGLIRHNQVHARNFSPLRYWLMMAVCDVVLYSFLVLIITLVAIAILAYYLLHSNLRYVDLLTIPFILVVYGMGSVPQAYLFSLGKSAALNSMALIIVNIVFGEATLVAKLFYGGAYDYAMNFMGLSPQYNMAYALVKIRQIYLYNSECLIFEVQKLCETKLLHKCCEKCGVLQECYKRKSYLKAIYPEMSATFFTAVLMFSLLFLWEYKILQLITHIITHKICLRRSLPDFSWSLGAVTEMSNVIQKAEQLRKGDKTSEFGANLLLVDVSRAENYTYTVRNVSLGLAKGQALALSGLKRHGRSALCQMIAGYKTGNDGTIWAVSKYKQRVCHHKYSKQVGFCGRLLSLPGWMTVYDGLEMMASLRGVPAEHRSTEVNSYIDALDLNKQADLQICHLSPSERYRLRFAATVVGAPPILVFDECAAYQSLPVQRSMYFIINLMRKRGHSIVHSAFAIEAHMPVTNQLCIMRDGRIHDIDKIDDLQERYGNSGYTVVVHLKDDVDIVSMFEQHFTHFVINDTTDVLVNVQILDNNLDWGLVFSKMETLKQNNDRVYSYIVCTKPIDYIYQTIISEETGFKPAADILSLSWLRKKLRGEKEKIEPLPMKILTLKKFTKKYSLTRLNDLPWSVIFQR